MAESGVDETLVRDNLRNGKFDKVLPFRFIAAAKYAPRWEPDIEVAMMRGLESMDRIPGRTALIVDTSPSMWMSKISAKSEMNRFEAAAALAILLREVCEDVNIWAFNSKAHEIPARRGFALRDALERTKDGYSCGGLAVEAANRRGYDRIIVITDGQWHYMNESLGWYKLLFREATDAALTSHPGRRSNITAINFALAGGALLLMEARLWAAVQAMIIAMMITALMALTSYLLGSLLFTRIGAATSIAPHTAINFLFARLRCIGLHQQLRLRS